MPSPPKVLLPKSVIFISARIQEGLPIVPAKYMKVILEGILGRVQRTVWCAGYDSPPVLTMEDVILKIAYMYTNPQTANLVDSIEQYPGLSSWNMFINNKKGFVAKWIQRPAIKKLERTNLSESEQEELRQS